jgi:hypothetical protein
VNLYGAYQNQQQLGGYLAPRITYGGTVRALTPTESFQINNRLQTGSSAPDTPNENPLSTVPKAFAAAPLDVIDSFASLFPGVKRGSINDSVYDSIGMPGFGQWVRDNKGSVEVGSGLLGAVAVSAGSELALAKMLDSSWFTASAIGRAISPTFKMVGTAKFAAARESLAAAESGQALNWFQGANRTFMITKVGASLAKAGTSEIAVMAALHNNSFVWSDDMHTNAVMYGLGLAMGGAGGLITGRAFVSKWANSTVMKEAFANAGDPGNYERLMATTPVGYGLASNMSKLRGPVRSAEFSTLMLNATRDDAAKGGIQRGSRNEIQTGNQRTALQVLQTLTRKGIGGVEDSNFNVTATGAGRHIIEASVEDPLILLGSTEVGVVGNRTAKQLITERQAAIDEVLSNPLAEADERHLAMLRDKETPLFILGKRLVTADEADDLSNYATPTFKTSAAQTKELTWNSPYSGKKFSLREDGRLSTDWNSLHPLDQQSVVDGMNAMLPKLSKITVPKNPTFMELDFGLKALELGKVVDFVSQAGLKDAEAASLKSLELKYLRAMEIRQAGGSLGFRERLGLNLALPTRLETTTDPDGVGFLNVIAQASKPNVSLSDLQTLRMQAMKSLDIGTDASLNSRLDGDLFSFNRATHGNKGEWLPVLSATYTDPEAVTLSRFDLGEMVAEQKALSLKVMMTKKNSVFTKNIAGAIVQSPVFKPVSEISGLDDIQISGTGSQVGATAAQVLTAGMRNRFSDVIKGAQAIRRVANRMTEIYLDSVLGRLTSHVDGLSAVAGQRSRILLNQYMTFTPGWDIKAAVPSAANADHMAFQLAKTERNARRLGRQVTDEDTIRGPNGVEVVLDPTANSARLALEQEYTSLLKERNAMREARGLEPVAFREFYTPPPSTRGKIVGFTLDSTGRPVPNGTVVAATRAQFDAAANKIKATFKPGDGQRFITQDSVHDFADMWEQAQMDWHNPSDFVDAQTLAGRSGPQQGLLQGMTVNPRGLEDALDFLKHGYEQVTNGTMRTIFDSQLKIARIRNAASELSKGTKPGVKSIWKTYEDTLMGISAMQNPTGINTLAKKADEWIDEGLKTIWPAASVSSNFLRDVVNKAGVGKLRKVQTFSDLSTALGPHMPFKSASDFAEYQYGLTAPWKAKELAQHANRFGAGIVLRWLEIPQAVMNMAGIITSMPGILQSSTLPLMGKVSGVGVVDVAKIMSRGFRRQFDHGTADWDYAVKMGATTQDVAELHHHLSMMKGKSSTARLLTGDPSYAGWEKLPKGSARTRAYLKFKGIEGMASILTDSSENLSRRWAHFVGLELADHHGITGMEARHHFANEIANQTIANYDPLNRPEIYQSAFGSMYGLFLSYAQNYYERMFRWAEVGDKKALSVSLGLQAAMFGFTSVPGYRQLESLIGNEEKGDGILDATYKRFGPATASVLAQGGFDQITRLIGLPAVSLHTRGDINFRNPGLDFAVGVGALPIGLETLKDVVSGTFQAVGSLVDPKVPNSGRYAAEILARNMPNRMIRGAISVLALGGQEADAYGNLMAETKSGAETAYRMLGLRSGRQQAEIEAYFMNQKAMAIDASKLDGVRAATRALVRSGKYDSLPQVFQKYVDAGGKPWNYADWISRIIKESGATRGENQLLKALRDPAHQELARRLQMMTAPY